jgi:hypothetical protein
MTDVSTMPVGTGEGTMRRMPRPGSSATDSPRRFSSWTWRTSRTGPIGLLGLASERGSSGDTSTWVSTVTASR